MRQLDTLPEASNLYGSAFEQFIFQEIVAYLSYAKIRKELTFWRSKNHQEVDFIIGNEIAIEIKATHRPLTDDHKGLLALMEEKEWSHTLLVTREKGVKSFKSGIVQVYWEDFLNTLRNNGYT